MISGYFEVLRDFNLSVTFQSVALRRSMKSTVGLGSGLGFRFKYASECGLVFLVLEF